MQQNYVSKNEGEIKVYADKQNLREFVAGRCPTRNAKGVPSGWNRRTPDSISNPYKEISIYCSGYYIGKHKNQYYYICFCSSTFDFLNDLKDNYINTIINLCCLACYI